MDRAPDGPTLASDLMDRTPGSQATGTDDADPSRPPLVPEGAKWLSERRRWQLVAAAPDGAKHGPVSEWRADGTLYLRGQYQQDALEGPFTIFHPNGQIARQGRYVGGVPDGEVL